MSDAEGNSPLPDAKAEAKSRKLAEREEKKARDSEEGYLIDTRRVAGGDVDEDEHGHGHDHGEEPEAPKTRAVASMGDRLPAAPLSETAPATSVTPAATDATPTGATADIAPAVAPAAPAAPAPVVVEVTRVPAASPSAPRVAPAAATPAPAAAPTPVSPATRASATPAAPAAPAPAAAPASTPPPAAPVSPAVAETAHAGELEVHLPPIAQMDLAPLPDTSADAKTVKPRSTHLAMTATLGRTKIVAESSAYDCPDVDASQVCYSGFPNFRKNIVLDAGHSEEEASRRNSDKVLHEGRDNTVMALLVRDLMMRCLKISDDKIKLTRWPGERRFGQYTNEEAAQGKFIRNNIPIENGQRIAFINYLLGIPNGMAGAKSLYEDNGVVISLHANTGNDEKRPKKIRPDYAMTIVDGSTRSSSPTYRFAHSVMRGVRDYTAPQYELQRARSSVRDNSKVLVETRSSVIANSRVGTANTLKILVEAYFMDGSERARMSSQLASKEKSLKVWKEVDGTRSHVDTYGISNMQIAAAQGVVKGFAESFACRAPASETAASTQEKTTTRRKKK